MNETKPVKVAHILKDLVVGGIQSLLLDLFTYYQQPQYPFIFIAIGGGEVKHHFQKQSIPAYFIEKQLPYFDPVLTRKIRQILKKEKVTVVHSHHTSEGVAAYFATMNTKVKLIQGFHVSPSLNNKQDNWAFKKLADKMGACIAPSKAQLTDLENAGYNTSKFQVVHNGVLPERIQITGKRNLKAELGLQEDTMLLGSVGNFYNKTRDQLTICKALPKVFEQFPNARFVFFGGHSNQYIKHPQHYKACVDFCKQAGIAGKVLLPGLEPDVGAIHGALDLFVYSSLHDTFGIAVVEAMINKIPVVVNDLPVLKEITDGLQHVYGFQTGNEDDLASAVIRALTNKQESAEMAAKAREFALSKYHIREHAAQLDRVYKNLVSS